MSLELIIGMTLLLFFLVTEIKKRRSPQRNFTTPAGRPDLEVVGGYVEGLQSDNGAKMDARQGATYVIHSNRADHFIWHWVYYDNNDKKVDDDHMKEHPWTFVMPQWHVTLTSLSEQEYEQQTANSEHQVQRIGPAANPASPTPRSPVPEPLPLPSSPPPKKGETGLVKWIKDLWSYRSEEKERESSSPTPPRVRIILEGATVLDTGQTEAILTAGNQLVTIQANPTEGTQALLRWEDYQDPSELGVHVVELGLDRARIEIPAIPQEGGEVIIRAILGEAHLLTLEGSASFYDTSLKCGLVAVGRQVKASAAGVHTNWSASSPYCLNTTTGRQVIITMPDGPLTVTATVPQRRTDIELPPFLRQETSGGGGPSLGDIAIPPFSASASELETPATPEDLAKDSSEQQGASTEDPTRSPSREA